MKTRKIVRFLITVVFIFAFPLCTTYASYNSGKSNTAKINSTHFTLKHYYYNQLNDIEKAIYNNLISSKEQFLKGEEIIFSINKVSKNIKLDIKYYHRLVKRSIIAFTYDNPEEAIWFNNYTRDYFRSEDYVYMILKPKNPSPSNLNSGNIRVAILNFETIVSNFVNTLSGTDTQKLQQIHDWLVARSTYDNTLTFPDTQTAYGAIINRRSICSGFAYAYKYIADIAGLDVLYVTGKFYNEQTNTFASHAWNIAFVDGQYLLVDVTFDVELKKTSPQEFLFNSISNNNHHIDSYYFDYSAFK